ARHVRPVYLFSTAVVGICISHSIYALRRGYRLGVQTSGHDPDASAEANEQAIAAWEQWHEDSGRIAFTPDDELVAVP
ncbi:MAG: hypothetical protein ACYTFQ_33005, partial [Planctomycetota bacterium]